MIQSNEDNLLASLEPIEDKSDLEKVVSIRTSRLTVVKGTVQDGIKEVFTPLEATIELFNNEDGQLVSSMKANSATGKFLITLPSGKDYGISVKHDGYMFYSENFNIPATSDYQEVELDIKLLPIAPDSRIVLRNVFFDRAKHELNPKSYAEADRLIKLLKENPSVRIEVSGHTDNEGNRQANIALSERRAKAVMTYLLKDIDQSRLLYKGYGFDSPVATNDSPEGRALNRRVEVKILK